jgi:hypothetical protein
MLKQADGAKKGTAPFMLRCLEKPLPIRYTFL